MAVFLAASDTDDDPLTFAIVDPPNNGTLDDCSSGSCTYTPDTPPNFLGTDTFTWTANDGISDSNVATFTVEVTANTAPVANDQTESTREAKPPRRVPGRRPDDDDDPADLQQSSIGRTTAPSTTAPRVLYLHAGHRPELHRPRRLHWMATDGLADSEVATVSIDVAPNQAPVALDDAHLLVL